MGSTHYVFAYLRLVTWAQGGGKLGKKCKGWCKEVLGKPGWMGEGIWLKNPITPPTRSMEQTDGESSGLQE